MYNRFIKKLNLLPKLVVVPSILLALTGFVLIYDAAGGKFDTYCKRQILFFAMFSVLCVSIAFIDTALIFQSSYFIYLVSVVLLCIASIIGHTAMGATRWVGVGSIKFQPSELAKLGLVLALARYFSTIPFNSLNRYKYLLIPVVLVAIPFLIVMKQPDLGSALVIAFVATVVFYLAGVNVGKFVAVIVTLVVSMPFIWRYLLKSYQKKRILMFLSPEDDPLGAGYNIIQSKIAVGSGGFFGKGRLESTQAKLDFLPEHHTDFIFSLFAEQFGFIGSIVLLLVFLTLLAACFYVGINHRIHFCRLVVCGLSSILGVHIVINLGMTIGLLPVVGIPLPLISYGGSSLGTLLISFGIILNMSLHRDSKILDNKRVHF
jgi:rod shape determining protein RodA